MLPICLLLLLPIHSAPLLQTYSQASQNTTLLFQDTQGCHARVSEQVVFRLESGVYTSVVRRLSLKPFSRDIQEVEVTSADRTIKDTQVVRGCEKGPQQVCLVSTFDKVTVPEDQTLLVTLDYEYLVMGMARPSDKAVQVGYYIDNT